MTILGHELQATGHRSPSRRSRDGERERNMHAYVSIGRRLLIALVLTGILAFGAAPALADTVTTTLTVGTGVLTEVAITAASASATAPGATASYPMLLTVTDTRGTGAGWNLTITSTPFHPVTGADFPTDASSITGVASACAPTCTPPTNVITYALGVPAGSTPPTAVKFFDAASATGMGVMLITPTIAVAVPLTASSTIAYTSTITLSIASAP
jgi:hypothetical protein